MSKGNRLFHAALGGCLSFFLLVAPVSAQEKVDKPDATVDEAQGVAGKTPPPKEDSIERTEGQQAPATGGASPLGPVDVQLAAEPSCGPDCQAAKKREKTDREKADLVAQESMARSNEEIIIVSWGQLFVAGLGLVALLYTLGLTRRATRAAIDANNIARDAMHLENRGWLKVSAKITSDIQCDAEGNAEFGVQFLIKNIGKSPAFAVSIHPGIYLYATDWPHPDVEQIDRAENIRGFHGNERGGIIFPDSDWKHNFILKIPNADAMAARAQTAQANETDEGWIFPYVMGCVQYLTSPNAKIPCQTGFIYAVRQHFAEEREMIWIPHGMSIDRGNIVIDERALDPRAVT